MQLKQLTCPQCQAVNSLKTSISKSIACFSCGAVLDTQTSELLQVKRKLKSSLAEDLSLGLRGTLNGISLEIVGYILYQDYIDGESYHWEEWFAVGNNKYYWLQYDLEDDQYTLFEQITLKAPLDFVSLRSMKPTQISPEESIVIDEVGEATIKQLDGEIPWKALVTERMNYADGHRQKTQYSIEWTADEVEVYKGKHINRKEVLLGFNLQERYKQYVAAENAKLKWPLIRPLLWIIFFGSLIAGFIALGSGSHIFSRTVTACDPKVISKCASTPMPIGPIKLSHVNRIHKIQIESKTASQTNWVAADIAFLDASQQPITVFGGDFWMENWYEDGESGTDSSLNANRMFQLTKAGDYYLDIDIEKQPVGTAAKVASNQPDTFVVTVYQDVILARYFFILSTASILFLGIKDGWLIRMLENMSD